MAISSKNVFEKFQQNQPHPHFHQTQQDPSEDIIRLSDNDLYKRFKTYENELKSTLEGRTNASIVLQEHTSFTNPKRKIVEVLMQIMCRSSMLQMIQQKQIDERFWTLIKKEIKRAEQELQKSNGSLKQNFESMLLKNKESLGNMIKQAWKTFEPLKEPHLPDAIARKMLGRLLVAVAETLKLKGKQDKSIQKDVRDFLNRSLKIYSFSGRTHELLGLFHQWTGDLFGAVYGLSRALSTSEPISCREQLFNIYDELRARWDQHQALVKVSSQPSWYISFCLSFLKIQGVYLTGVNTDDVTFLMRCCLENMDVFLGRKENAEQYSNLLVSMVQLWIFTVHITVKDYRELQNLVNHDPSLFSGILPGSATQVFEYFSQFMHRIVQKIENWSSSWLGAVLIFLYWINSYRDLPKLLLTPSLKEDLETLMLTFFSIPDSDCALNLHLLLPEDARSIGFLPLHDYYLSHKDFLNEPAPVNQYEIIRATIARELINDLLEHFKEKKEVKEDEFWDPLGFDVDQAGLFFEEVKEEKRLIIIDGSNVAIRHGNGAFSCKGIKIAIEYFQNKGYEAKAVVPDQYLQGDRVEELKLIGANAKKIPVGFEILKTLDSKGLLIKTPPWDYDDSYALQYGKDKNAVIISNDRYRDHIQKHPENGSWVRTHTCSYTYVGDDFIPNPDFNFNVDL